MSDWESRGSRVTQMLFQGLAPGSNLDSEVDGEIIGDRHQIDVREPLSVGGWLEAQKLRPISETATPARPNRHALWKTPSPLALSPADSGMQVFVG